jgi:S1-C subfamily serine protease
MIISKTDSEIQVLVYAPNIDSAQTIQVTLFDGSSVEAEIRARDRASGLVVLSAGISDVDRAVREQLTAATLGSSSPTYITGLMVIAVGRPIGTSGSISYGSASSATGDLAIQDSGLKQITTDIYGSRQASGFLLNPMGQVVGILDPRHGRSDLPNLLCAIGISECKPLIEKLSAGGKKAYLGVQCTDVPAEIRKRMSIPDGVYVNGVADVSPAMNAGLQKGDVITAMAGEDIYYSSGVSRILLEAEAGEELVITLMRPSGEGYTQMELTAALE